MTLITDRPSDWKGPRRRINMKGSIRYNTSGLRKEDWPGSKEGNKAYLLNLRVKKMKRKSRMRKQRKPKPQLKVKTYPPLRLKDLNLLWTTKIKGLIKTKQRESNLKGNTPEWNLKETAKESSQKDSNDYLIDECLSLS